MAVRILCQVVGVALVLTGLVCSAAGLGIEPMASHFPMWSLYGASQSNNVTAGPSMTYLLVFGLLLIMAGVGVVIKGRK